MPTGACNYPHHHGGPSAGPPLGLLAAIVAGALIIANLHAVIVTLAVVAVLAVLAAGVVLLVHSHRSEPYDGSWAGSEPAELPRAEPAAAVLQARVTELERQLAALPAIEAPQQHLHLHGLGDDAIAALAGQLGRPPGDPLPIEADPM